MSSAPLTVVLTQNPGPTSSTDVGTLNPPVNVRNHNPVTLPPRLRVDRDNRAQGAPETTCERHHYAGVRRCCQRANKPPSEATSSVVSAYPMWSRQSPSICRYRGW